MDEKAADAIRFFAIEQGSHDDWQIHYILATSAQDAADRYIKRIKTRMANWLSSPHYHGQTTEAKVYETTFDEFGVLQRMFDLADDRPVLSIQVPD